MKKWAVKDILWLCRDAQKHHKLKKEVIFKWNSTRHRLSKDVRPDMESPWSVDFKTAFIFEFLTYSGVEMGCQRYFMILPGCAKTPQISKK